MDTSPLNKLPAELRNTIYELVLVSPTDITLRASPDSDILKTSTQGLKTVWALTQTCRELRTETLPVFYGANIFHLIAHKDAGSLHKMTSKWVKDIGSCAAMIRGVKVTPENWSLGTYADDFFSRTVRTYPALFNHPDVYIRMIFGWVAVASPYRAHYFSLNLTKPDVELLEMAFEEVIERLRPLRGVRFHQDIMERLERDKEEMDDFVELLREWNQKHGK